MDCHGVAQQLGYAFSFVLLGNQSGAGIDTQTDAEIPPRPNAIVPTGSYQLTCDNLTLSGSTVKVDCRTRAQLFQASTLDITTCKAPHSLSNQNGPLTCDQPVSN